MRKDFGQGMRAEITERQHIEPRASRHRIADPLEFFQVTGI